MPTDVIDIGDNAETVTVDTHLFTTLFHEVISSDSEILAALPDMLFSEFNYYNGKILLGFKFVCS